MRTETVSHLTRSTSKLSMQQNEQSKVSALSPREIVSEFIKNKHKPDIRISDLQTGDVFVCYDKPYYHAIEPVVSGVRQTSIIRWDNNDRQY